MNTKKFEKKILNTIKSYNLINEKEKVLVAASGGKDSTTILHILKKHNYNVKAFTIDLGIANYSKKNIINLKNFCTKNKIKLHIADIRKETGHSVCYVVSLLKSKGINMKTCNICGIFKRQIINKFARSNNFDKVVTGHNLDDELQSFLMNFFKSNTSIFPRLGPRTGIIEDKLFVPRVKPLYFCSEKEITEYSKKNNFPVIYDPCPCSFNSYRRFVKEIINKNNLDKEKAVRAFLKLSINLRKKIKKEKINHCIKCSEPAKEEECKACRIINMIN